jgi:hypothetical protein
LRVRGDRLERRSTAEQGQKLPSPHGLPPRGCNFTPLGFIPIGGRRATGA